MARRKKLKVGRLIYEFIVTHRVVFLFIVEQYRFDYILWQNSFCYWKITVANCNVNDLVTVCGNQKVVKKNFVNWPWKTKNSSSERLCNAFYVAYGHIIVTFAFLGEITNGLFTMVIRIWHGEDMQAIQVLVTLYLTRISESGLKNRLSNNIFTCLRHYIKTGHFE